MPVDHKRINGPDETFPYYLFSKLNIYSSSQKLNNIVKNGKRRDNRSLLEHRKIFVKTNVVSQAKGSAYIEMGKSKVIVSVFDPREIPNRQDYSLKGELHCEFKYAPFSCQKRRLHQQDAEEKNYSAIMKQALESTVCTHEFPNFQVDICALVLHNGGSCLSAAITAAGLALSHAGVPMYDLITSATVGIQGDIVILDPTVEEENICAIPIGSKNDKDHGVVIISLLHTHKQISQIYQSGNLSLNKFLDVIKHLETACENIIPLIQKCLIKHVTKSLKNQ